MDDEAEEEEDEDGFGGELMFKVKLEKAEPEHIKISKKNTCIVTISKNESEDGAGDQTSKLVEFFV